MNLNSLLSESSGTAIAVIVIVIFIVIPFFWKLLKSLSEENQGEGGAV